MKSNVTHTQGALASILLVLSLSIPVMTTAQQKELSVEELEAYIVEQKEVLEEARTNRDKTQKKVDKVQEALAEQDARKALVEKELETLCSEQEKLKPGTYEDCMADSNS